MKILTAIDSMKGSLTSKQANTVIKKVFEAAGHEVFTVSIADGGEGTMEALIENASAEYCQTEVHNLQMKKITAEFGWIAATKTAILEAAEASGIQFTDFTEQTHPKNTNSYGTGELIKQALDVGAKRIIIGIGGTGTVDGGIGLASALGVEFFDSKNEKIHSVSGKDLRRIEAISLELLDSRIAEIELIIASDVDNFLIGAAGAVKMFGQQKGILSEEIDEYESWMEHYADILYKQAKPAKGDGAAGGIGAALRILLKAKVFPGFQFIAKEIGLDEKISKMDLVITGEGKMDNQSLHGKVPVGISSLAQKYQIPVVAFAGAFEGDKDRFKEAGIQAIVPIVDKITTLEEAMSQASVNLERAASRTLDLIELFKTE